MFTQEQKDMLSAKLSSEHVKTRQITGRTLSYLEGWVAISEANRIFGFDGWTRETVFCEEVSRVKTTIGRNNDDGWKVGYMAKVRITAGDIVREGTGHGSASMRDLFDCIESAAKEAETDAMKRALMTFGNPFGLALYDKDQANVERSGGLTGQADKRMADSIGKFKRKSAGPALIPVPDIEPADKRWRAWGNSLTTAIKASKAPEEVAAWIEENAVPLKNLGKFSAKAHDHIMGVAEAKKDALKAEAGLDTTAAG